MGEALEAAYSEIYDNETLEKIEKNFSRLKDECYCDHAGATLHSDTQLRNIVDDLSSSLYANPHSAGTISGITYDSVDRMRLRILHHFHTSAEEYSVIFTSGATSSLKIIAESFAFHDRDDYKNENKGSFIYTQDNHTSVLGMRDVVAQKGAKVICLKHDEAFRIINQSLASSSNKANQISNSLFVYPAQCNFSGLKYPLEWIKYVQAGALSTFTENVGTKWYVLLDAASFVPTNDLDLSIVKPDFVCLSFYKIFGYPTGIGALLVKNSSADVLRKVYYGGGTVDVSLSSEMYHVKRKILHQRFEDGTVPFLSIISLRHGFDEFSKIPISKISYHVYSLAKFLYYSLLTLHHNNGTPIARLYSDTDYEDKTLQGGIVTFNLLRSNGEYVGYMEVLNMAALFKIQLRTGCFCNPGACQRHLSLSNKEVLQNYDAGYVCGGTADLLYGKPTGAVRISFGYMSTIKDVESLLFMIKKCFLDGSEIIKLPTWWNERKAFLRKKYSQTNTVSDNNIKKLHESNEVLLNDCKNGIEGLKDPLTELKYFVQPKLNKVTKQAYISHLFVYPIKSCAAYEVKDSWILNSKGLEYDREWMIVTSAGMCLTQKQQSNICLIKPIICKETNIMKLTYPGMPSIEVPLKYTSNKRINSSMCQSKVCGHGVEGIDCGLDVSEWLSLALGRPNLRLIRQYQTNEVNDKSTLDLSFSSQAQYLLLNENSILWLTNKISKDADFQRDTVLHRFRGNIVVTGCEAFEEAQWKQIHIGNNIFTVNGLCTRCQMICIDQTTGKKTIEPLRTLAKEFHGKLKFGIYLTRQTKEQNSLSLGSAVNIMR